MNPFTVEEINLICVFEEQGRTELIAGIRRVLPYLEDGEMLELSMRVLEKLETMSDETFAKMVLEAAE